MINVINTTLFDHVDFFNIVVYFIPESILVRISSFSIGNWLTYEGDIENRQRGRTDQLAFETI